MKIFLNSASSLLPKTQDHVWGPSTVFEISKHLGILNVRHAFKVLDPLDPEGRDFLTVPRVRSVTYELAAFSFFYHRHLWNSLPEDLGASYSVDNATA